MKSNVLIGTPLDIFCYESDSLTVKYRYRMNEGDAYMEDVRSRWRAGLVQLVSHMPKLHFQGVDKQPGEGAR